jgi:hypothetical protein
MQENFQQTPKPRTPSGYRPLIPTDLGRVAANPAYAYIAAAAGIGLLAGLGIAVIATAGHAKIATAPIVSPAIVSQASGLPTLQASYTGAGSSLLSIVDPSKKANATTPQFSLASDQSEKKSAVSHKRHGLQKLWPWKKGSDKQDNAKRKPYVSPNAPAAEEPTALELATAAAATGPFVLGIQGDATIASYDVATGTVETYEGSSFVLDKTVSENGAIAFQDFPFNVHYSCDQTHNCTIVRHGATASARLMRQN